MWKRRVQRNGSVVLVVLGLLVGSGLSGCAAGARTAARLHGYKTDAQGNICAPAQYVGGVCQPQPQGALR